MIPRPEALAAKGDALYRLVAQPHAIHLRRDEGLRLIVCLLREQTREGQPRSESEPPTIRSVEPLAPRRWSVCRRIRVGQLRKVSPHRSRKWPLTSAGDALVVREL
jgi:hypothetical protein